MCSVGENFYILNTEKDEDKLLLLTGARSEKTGTRSDSRPLMED